MLICLLGPKFNHAGKVWPSPDAWMKLVAASNARRSHGQRAMAT